MVKRKGRRKHRWKLMKETVVDSAKSVRREWACRRCGFVTATWHEHPPSGMLLDQDGRDCASRVVTEVMAS